MQLVCRAATGQARPGSACRQPRDRVSLQGGNGAGKSGKAQCTCKPGTGLV